MATALKPFTAAEVMGAISAPSRAALNQSALLPTYAQVIFQQDRSAIKQVGQILVALGALTDADIEAVDVVINATIDVPDAISDWSYSIKPVTKDQSNGNLIAIGVFTNRNTNETCEKKFSGSDLTKDIFERNAKRWIEILETRDAAVATFDAK